MCMGLTHRLSGFMELQASPAISPPPTSAWVGDGEGRAIHPLEPQRASVLGTCCVCRRTVSITWVQQSSTNHRAEGRDGRVLGGYGYNARDGSNRKGREGRAEVYGVGSGD
jgi:hypothetical protein